jgi:AraC-like DNA-binding protein
MATIRRNPVQVDESAGSLPAVTGVVHYRGPALSAPEPRFHRSHVLSCHLRAAGRYFLGGDEIEVKPPSLVLLPFGVSDHNRLTAPMDAYWCHLASAGIAAGARGRARVSLLGAVVERAYSRTLSGDEAASAVDLFREMRSHDGRGDLASRLVLAARALDLITLWARPLASEDGGAVEAYRALIERHAADERVALSDLARQVGRAPDHLGASFRRAHGVPPMEYRMRARLLHARSALADGASVAAAARAGGFSDPRYFARQFRRRYRTTPSEFSRDVRR